MSLDITSPPPTTGTTRIKPIALRLPRGLADQITEKSKVTGQSVNQLLVEAVRSWLGEGGQATEDRIANLETDVTNAVTAFATATEGLDDLTRRVERIEQVARQSGANL